MLVLPIEVRRLIQAEKDLLARVAELEKTDRVVRRVIARLADGLQVAERTSPQLTLAACSVQVGIIHRESDGLKARVEALEKSACKLTSFWTGLGGGRVAVRSAPFDELMRVADQRGEGAS